MQISQDTVLYNVQFTCSVGDGSPCIHIGPGVQLTILGGVIEGNDEHTGRGITLDTDSKLQLFNVQMSKFKASVVYASEKAGIVVFMDGCQVSDNTWGSTGAWTTAPIYLEGCSSCSDNNGDVYIRNSLITNNIATSFSAGSYIRDVARVDISYTNFTNNQGGYAGSFSVGNVENLSISNSTFQSNKAGKFGGGVFLSQGIQNGVISSSQIVDNSAGLNGGGIFFASSSSVTIGEDVVIKGNKANTTGEALVNGDGIYCKSSIGITLPSKDFQDEIFNC